MPSRKIRKFLWGNEFLRSLRSVEMTAGAVGAPLHFKKRGHPHAHSGGFPPQSTGVGIILLDVQIRN